LYRIDDYQFFILSMVIGGPASGVANPKLWGSKCLTSGKQQHFCLGHHFSKHKMTGYAKIWSVCLPWLCLCVLHCLFFMRILHTQLFFTYFHEYMFISPKWY